MKWHALSETGVALMRQLADESKAWLGRRGKLIRSLRAIAALGEPAAISAIVGFLLDDDQSVAQEATLVVEGLFALVPLELLPTLDERIRADSNWGFPSDRWRMLAVGAIDRLRSGPSDWLVLGLASCHGSGYVRQSAIARLDREITFGAEIPFLLLRLNDWVPAVRQAAEPAISNRLTDSHRAAYIQNLSLIFRLKSRLRAGESPALARIESLLQSDPMALISGTLASESRVARRFGLFLALNSLSGPAADTQRVVLERVIESNDPAARLQLACWLAKQTTSSDVQGAFLRRLLSDRFAAVRRVALGWCAAREPGIHLAALHDALLDQSCTVRSIAQFHLPKLEPIDLRAFYRDTISTHDARALKAALGGLGETGRPLDAELIVPFTAATEIGVRKAALLALAKLALVEHLEIFITALQAESPGVSRQARIALETLTIHIGGDRLAAIFFETPHDHVPAQALALIHRLPKWQVLPLLVEIIGRHDGPLWTMAKSYLHGWISGFNRTHHIQPTRTEIARVRASLDTHGNKLERNVGRELHALAATLRRD